MVDRWAKFNKKYDDEVQPLKAILNITIYGSYFPEEEKQFLIDQRDYLRDKGFKKTYIVEDYPDPSHSSKPLDKSIRCLEYSDVNFLIFTRAGKNQGAGRELTYIATTESMFDRIPFSVVFDQTRDEQGSISVLSMNDIENSGIVRREFENEPQLRNGLYQQTMAKLRMLQNILKRRM